LIPLINVVNYYLTYTNVPVWRVIITFTIDTAEGYIAWLLTHWIIGLLDRRFPYEGQPVKRILVQLFLTLLAGLGSIIILTEFVNWLATDQPVPLSFYTTDILIISIWFFVVNGIYVSLHYHNQWLRSEEARKKEASTRMGGFKISTAKKDLLLPYEEIYGFYIDDEYCVLATVAGKKHLLGLSLDQVEKQLPPEQFFRANRQFIVHRALVNGYEKAENSKIVVLLRQTEHLPETVAVSRTKASAFKTWLFPG
jgi:hypothetical protein